MANLNQVNLIGTVCKDIELKIAGNGLQIANLNLAINREYNGKKDVYFAKITLFGKLAENAEKYLMKGSQVYIGGYLHMNEWQDRNGNKRTDTIIIGESMQFLSSKKESAPASEVPYYATDNNFLAGKIKNDVAKENNEDDIPF